MRNESKTQYSGCLQIDLLAFHEQNGRLIVDPERVFLFSRTLLRRSGETAQLAKD